MNALSATESELIKETYEKEEIAYILKLTEETVSAQIKTIQMFVDNPINARVCVYAMMRPDLLRKPEKPSNGVHTDLSHFLAQHYHCVGLPERPDKMWKALEQRFQDAVKIVRADGHDTLEGHNLAKMVVRTFKQI